MAARASGGRARAFFKMSVTSVVMRTFYAETQAARSKRPRLRLRYIHRNPVARGLVASPEQWQWSSFRWYSSGEVGPVKINDTDILVMTIRPPAA